MSNDLMNELAAVQSMHAPPIEAVDDHGSLTGEMIYPRLEDLPSLVASLEIRINSLRNAIRTLEQRLDDLQILVDRKGWSR
jgi:hypothetical protein